MIVVSNASPLIALSLIGRLELLPALYGEIHIARAIHSEVVTRGRGRAGAAILRKSDWLVTHSVSRRALASFRPRPAGLHSGEVDTIALAVQLHADFVLIDERLARKFAESKGLQVLGTLGILKYARSRKMLLDLRAVLNDLRSKGFRFTDELYEQILSG